MNFGFRRANFQGNLGRFLDRMEKIDKISLIEFFENQESQFLTQGI